MGWVLLALVGAAAWAGLWRLGLARSLWSFAGAGLMLGAAGYAWQGRPTLGGAPARPFTETAPVDAEVIALRDALVGRFTEDGAYLLASDAMLRSGNRQAAVRVLLGGLRKLPRSFALWMGLGTAVAEHDGQVSPAALFAFQRAARLAPEHPAPPFFLGLAYVRADDFAKAQPLWTRALALTPPDFSRRREIANRLELLNRYLALTEGSRGP